MTGRLAWRRVVVLVIGSGLLLSALSVAAVAQERRNRDDGAADAGGSRGDAVAWRGARLEKPGSRRLIVHFSGGGPPDAPVGPCNPRYEATAAVTGDTMTVTVRGETPPSEEPVACTAMAYARTVTVALPVALQRDTLVDGATGETMPVFDVAALRTPAALPDGYEFDNETVSTVGSPTAPLAVTELLRVARSLH